MRKVLCILIIAAAALPGSGVRGAETLPGAEAEAAYTRVITERADKIVATLGISDSDHAAKVRSIITQQYRDLSQIHDARDEQIKTAKEKSGAAKSAVDAATQLARDQAKIQLDKLHAEFLAKLHAELSTRQVDQVKDGLTYGVVNGTFEVYLKMYPTLTDEQKQQIKDWLIEAREIAMDQGTSKEKHAVFGKYKGKINNYLSKAGYDAKQGEQNLKQAAKPGSESKSK